ncbi:hypothetical protein [Gordonia zhaorongruii]|uniref:hypothetical protein n=1 Tax=Gordonia zhaorongruii TaxID=2597659 RepID=UPI0010516A66|nr:hypothetical protein [Gordonia zhaorongruii]
MALSDKQLVSVLDRSVGVIDPLLDVLAGADPLRLKPRTFDDAPPTSCASRTADAFAWTLDVADWPGTAGWDELSMNGRADWWVSRIGAVSTAAVAFPSLLGPWTKVLPVGSYLGYAGQALVIRAVGRVYGVTSRAAGVVILAQILFDRDVSPAVVGLSDDAPSEQAPEGETGVLSTVWELGKTLYDLSQSLDSRPSAPRVIGWASWIPLLGGPLAYVGERIALRRAVDECRAWIAAHPSTIDTEANDQFTIGDRQEVGDAPG